MGLVLVELLFEELVLVLALLLNYSGLTQNSHLYEQETYQPYANSGIQNKKMKETLNQILYSLCGLGEYAKSGIYKRNGILESQRKHNFSSSFPGKSPGRKKYLFHLMMPVLRSFLLRRVSISCQQYQLPY